MPKLVDFPGGNIADIPACLRALADSIEAGVYGTAHHVAWVIDCGDQRIDVGMAGSSPEPGAVAHHLLAMGQRRLELL